MFSFALAPSMRESWGSQFLLGGVTSPNGMICYFTGAVPQSIAEIPFDTQNIYEVAKNMEGCLRYTSTKQSDSTTGRVKYLATQDRTYVGTKMPYFEQDTQKWSYTPKLIVIEQIWDDIRNGNFDNLTGSTLWGTSLTGSFHNYLQLDYHMSLVSMGLNYQWNKFRTRDFAIRNFTDYGYYSYYGVSSSRNAGNIYPLVYEYDEAISVDSFEYYRGWFTGDTNSAAYVDIFYWDDTLLEGAGDWVLSERVTLAEGGTESPLQFATLVNPITSRAFKLSFGDTASSTLHFAYLRFLSNTSPTTPRTSTDITWGLVIPSQVSTTTTVNPFTNVYEFNRVRPRHEDNFIVNEKTSYKGQHQMPVLLVDVGGPHDSDRTVNLTKANNVQPGDVPELLNFIIEFLD